jgi:phosphatidylinositol 4-kinase
LLRISSSHHSYIDAATVAIFSFISQTVVKIKTGSGEWLTKFTRQFLIFVPALDVLTQLTPALHGLYRAISSTSFPWTSVQWQQLATHLNTICAPDVVDRLNHALADVLQKESSDADTLHFIQTFLSRYVSHGRPLSGYFVVCCVIETEWTVLAQALAPPQTSHYGNAAEAAAANKAWLSLMRRAALDLNITDEKIRSTLKATIEYAMQCFADLLVQIEEMESEPSLDTYAWETMSESLVSCRLP